MREYQSSVVRAHVEALRASPEFPRLRASLRPPLQAFVDQPPSAGWVSSANLDELFDAALPLFGVERMRAVGRASMSGGLARFAMPAVRTIFALFGMGPDVLFTRMQSFVGGVERGTAYGYEPSGETAGVVVVRADVPFSTGGMHVFEGALAGMLEMTKRSGSVARHSRVDGGREIRVPVHWS